MLAEAVIDRAEKAVPQPGVVLSGEIWCIVWELLWGGRCFKDFWWVFAKDGEKLWACVGRERNIGYG